MRSEEILQCHCQEMFAEISNLRVRAGRGGVRGVPSNSVCACGGREGKLRNSQVARARTFKCLWGPGIDSKE